MRQKEKNEDYNKMTTDNMSMMMNDGFHIIWKKSLPKFVQ